MTYEEVEGCLNKIGVPNVLVIGDLMIDEYLWGEVERISPEAPVQIVNVKREAYALGGAGNVVNNLVSLGASVYIASVIGDGTNAHLLKSKFEKLGVNTDGLFNDPSRLTIKKTRILALSQQVLRIDRENRHPIALSWEKRIIQYVIDNIEKFAGIIISDYLKGVVTKNILKQIIALGKQYNRPVIIDPKGLDFTKYRGASIITPNLKEASYATQLELNSDTDVLKAASILLDLLKLEAVLITRGKDGLTLLEQGKSACHIPTRAREVYDVAGAGDTVSAMLGLGICSGLYFYQSAALANLAAGIVVGKVGVATTNKEEILHYAAEEQHSSHHKIKSPNEIKEIITNCRIKNKTTVFISERFDCLQSAHVNLLQRARKLGDVLIVGINNYVETKKSCSISAQERAHIISALDCVNFVFIHEKENPQEIINLITPHIVVIGKGIGREYRLNHSKIEEYGGRVRIIEVMP